MAISRKKRMKLVNHLLTHLFLIVFTIITMIPIWWVVTTSFDANAVGISATKFSILPSRITFNNYIRVLSTPQFLTWLKNSFVFAGGTTLFSLTIATLAAYAYSRFNFPGKKSGMMFFLIVMMLPTTTALIPQYLLMKNLGLLNKYIGMIILWSAGQMTFAIWNLKGYIDTVPLSLEEAAIVDGASKFQVFTKVIMPLSAPALAVTALVIFMSVWTDFATAFLFISKTAKYTLAMGIYNWAADPRNIPYPLFAAGAMIIAMPIAILYMVFQRYLVSGLTAGGVKG